MVKRWRCRQIKDATTSGTGIVLIKKVHSSSEPSTEHEFGKSLLKMIFIISSWCIMVVLRQIGLKGVALMDQLINVARLPKMQATLQQTAWSLAAMTALSVAKQEPGTPLQRAEQSFPIQSSCQRPGKVE